MSQPPNPSSIGLIDFHARHYAAALAVLAERAAKFEAEVQAIRNRLLPGIRSTAALAAHLQGEIGGEIARHPDLFVKPRTIILHGIRVGLVKGRGKITWDDDEKVIAAIRRAFAPPTADKLIATIERPIKDALAQLPAAELRRLGVQIEEAGDQVHVKAIDSEADKLAARILAEYAVDAAAAG